jgi:pimeloyl-ACP methyl ester carboxylesterase
MSSSIPTGRFVVGAGLTRIVGESAGAGPALVFLHAGVADRRMWHREMAALQGSHRVIAYDRRGFGETQAPEVPFSHVEDLAAVLDHLGCAKATLVGCSQGGRIAIDFALLYPERVTALVLVAPAVSGAASPTSYPPEVAERIEEIDEAEAEHDLDRINALEAWLWLDGPTSREGRVEGEARDLFLEMNGVTLHHPEIGEERRMPAAFPRLGQLAMPVLVVWGDLDFEHIQRRSAHIAATAPDARSLLMPGTAHLPNLEQPAVFIAKLTGFLGSLARAAE